jgi:hypothetical protein
MRHCKGQNTISIINFGNELEIMEEVKMAIARISRFIALLRPRRPESA